MQRPLQHMLLVPLILTSTASAYGQTIDLAMRRQIDQATQRCLQTDGTPSASVAIVVDDHLAYANAFGEAVLTTHLPASTATRYQLASISKTFTAQAVLLLVAHGKLSPHDPVRCWVPDLKIGRASGRGRV